MYPRENTTPEQDAQWSRYTHEIFAAMLKIVRQPGEVASDTAKLETLAELAEVGFEGAVIGSGVEDFIHTLDWLRAKEVEVRAGQPKQPRPQYSQASPKPLVILKHDSSRITALLEALHQTLYAVDDERVAEANLLLGWGAEASEQLTGDLDLAVRIEREASHAE